MMRHRRASNNLGADPRGDTGASALSTLDRPPTSTTASVSTETTVHDLSH